MGSKESKKKVYAAVHDLKFDNFKFVSLNKLEIRKSIYNHTKVVLEGVINEKDIKKYSRYLEQDDPELIITYENESPQIIFKGIITDYKITSRGQVYYLDIEAYSYSILLTRKRRNRIYQNLGTTYKEVLNKISGANDNFNIVCADSALGNKQLVSNDYPLVLQYKETDWDFIRRISSYLDEPLIVDDTKDNSETINIQIGSHNSRTKDLGNVGGMESLKTGQRNTKYNHFKVRNYRHLCSSNLFNIGIKVNYIINNETGEEVELCVIKNNIYIKKGTIRSELVLIKEEDINIYNVKRKYKIEGRSFRAEVMKLNQKHQAKVKFIDLEDDFKESKAFWFPIDRLYTDAFFAPEVGDTVDIYFKGKNEKHATLKSSSTDCEKEVDNNPEDKVMMTPEGYQLKINNESIFVIGKDEKTAIEVTKDTMNMKTEVEGNDNNLLINKDLIELSSKKAKLVLDGSQTAVIGGAKVKIASGSITLS